ncbi:hypothetical [Yersinia pestis KIM10+]|uniref:Uncharacterized protein n=1 Tax=Yersinia pestis TaxID=632 RepID=Q8CLT5_YERPE|nr:hypothetical [Yersinia pestis KIM10+]
MSHSPDRDSSPLSCIQAITILLYFKYCAGRKSCINNIGFVDNEFRDIIVHNTVENNIPIHIFISG